jgi:hypothetical protein
MADPARDLAPAAPEPDPVADRRDSPRRAIELHVRDLALGGSFERHAGNLSLGGVYFAALHPPQGSRLELRLLLAGEREEVKILGEVLRVSADGPRFGVHVKFVDAPVETELAVARYLERKA